jgi:flagellar protein FlaJ
MIEPTTFFIIISFGILFYFYYKYKKRKEIIEYFPKFFQEVYNNIASGMSLVDAVRKSKEFHYGRLTPFIKNMCSQIEWGIPFQVAIRNFSNKIKDPFINKIVALTEKAFQFSPDIGKSIRDINEYVLLTKELERERYIEIFPQVISIYFIFFVFLFVVFVLFNYFIPPLKAETSFYENIFKHLILIEAILTGLVLGKISEGSYLAGIKHLILLSLLSMLFFICNLI